MKFPDLKSESSPMIYLESLILGNVEKNIGDKHYTVFQMNICLDVPRSEQTGSKWVITSL